MLKFFSKTLAATTLICSSSLSMDSDQGDRGQLPIVAPLPPEGHMDDAARLYFSRVARSASIFPMQRRQGSEGPRTVPAEEPPIPDDKLADDAAKLHLARLQETGFH